MFFALVNGKNEVKGKTFAGLKRAASMVANNTFNAIDSFVMWNDIDGVLTCPAKGMTFTRINKKSPDNRIIRGQWH